MIHDATVNRWNAFLETLETGYETLLVTKWRFPPGWYAGNGPPRPCDRDELGAALNVPDEGLRKRDWHLVDYGRVYERPRRSKRCCIARGWWPSSARCGGHRRGRRDRLMAVIVLAVAADDDHGVLWLAVVS